MESPQSARDTSPTNTNAARSSLSSAQRKHALPPAGSIRDSAGFERSREMSSRRFSHFQLRALNHAVSGLVD